MQSRGRAYGLIRESIALTEPLRDFKVELARLLLACQATAYLPGELLVHIRKEADFFLGLLYSVTDQSTPTREDLGIPDGVRETVLLPRMLIGTAPANLNILSQEYGLFWVKRHQEHAEVLGLYTRPQVQEALLASFAEFTRDFTMLYEEGVRLNERATGMTLDPAWADWDRRAILLTVRWRETLANLYQDLLTCRVPTGQINIYPLIVDHIRRESDYTLDALNRILTAAGYAVM